MAASFLALLEESTEAAVPGTAEAMQYVAARLEIIRAQWDAQAPHLNVEELSQLRQRLGQLGLLIDHAASTRMGLARHMVVTESGYTAEGMHRQPTATSWECKG